MKRQAMRHVSWWLAALVALAGISLAEALLRSWPVLALVAAAAAGAYWAGHRRSRRSDAHRAELARQLAELGHSDCPPDKDPRQARSRAAAGPRPGGRPLGGAQWPR